MPSLRERLLARTSAVPTGGLGRVWRSGRTSAAIARAIAKGDADPDEVARLVLSLGELKGVAMKAGQMLGYLDPTLPEPVRAAMATLQTAAPATPFDDVLRAVEAAGFAGLVATLELEPLAVGSIGQVHGASLPGGARLAVKVRHPGIAEALANEFGVAKVGASVAEALVGGVGGYVDEAEGALLDECDYALEADRQRRLGALFACDPDLVIPGVVSASADVLVTEYVGGRPLDDVPAGPCADRLGEALFRFHLGGLYRAGLFHADPHPGNYAVDGEGRLVVYDFGCVRAFDEGAVAALAGLASAVRRDDLGAMRAGLARLGGEAGDDRDLRRLLTSFFGPFVTPGRRAMPADAGVDMRRAMRDKRAFLRLRLPGRLLFLFRLRFGLYAVLSRLGAVADWSALEEGLASAARSDHPSARPAPAPRAP